MKIERVVVGPLQENCYIVSINDKCLVIDPGDEFEKIKKVINDREVVGILITHNHFDHVGALNDVKNYYNSKVYDFSNLEEKEHNIGPFMFEVIYNPGHTMDSISFYFKEESVMFVGDFIFLNSVGRCDLEGGNYYMMEESIDKIKHYSDNIIIYPGHGNDTTLGYEKMHNSFF